MNPEVMDVVAELERLLKEATPGPWGMPDRAEGLVSAGDVHSGWTGMIASVDAGDYARAFAWLQAGLRMDRSS